MSSGTGIWWVLISIISVMNIGLWIYSAVIFSRRKPSIGVDNYIWRRWILWLSGIYVLGCAFRSFLPRIDVERICLVDTWLSSMIVGRSVATIAEICFMVQCAILLREAGKGINVRMAVMISMTLVPMIILAEGFSWYATISTHYLGSVVEESLWTIAGVLLVGCLYTLWPHVSGNQRHFLTAMIAFAIGFIVFMVTVDVPMYWTRWQADLAAGAAYLPFNQGLLDAANAYTVNFEWEIWHEEIPWMTLYFTVAVWVSIYLTHAPNFKIIGKTAEK